MMPLQRNFHQERLVAESRCPPLCYAGCIMAKARKPPAAPEPPTVGDKVRPGKSEMVYEISSVSPQGDELNSFSA